MVRYGYCCINMELGKQKIRTGRTMIQRKFEEGGLQLASDIALENAMDLLPILQWNEERGIRLFRIGSEIFPRWNHYKLEDLPEIILLQTYFVKQVIMLENMDIDLLHILGRSTS
jgi:UV DNA damage endonuclease